MAFCKNCGTDMGDAHFCPGCGTPVEGASAPSAPVMDVRQRSLQDMENMRAYFGKKAAQYDEFAAVNAEVAERSAKGFGGYIVAAVISVVLALLLKAVFFWFVAALCVGGFILFKKKNADKLAVVAARQAELSTELETYYKDYGYCPIGFEYTSPAMLESLHEMIRKGRASNPSDAINLLLDDLRKEEELEQLKATRAAAEETAKNTKTAAKAAKKSARYSAASFWFK